MYIDKLLLRGSYCMIEPVGLHIIVEYNKRGAIDKVYQFTSDDSYSEIQKSMFNLIIKHNVVPRTVLLKEGTTKVSGVLYSNHPINSIGCLPFDAYDELWKQFESNIADFKFIASNVSSQAAVFPSHISARQWLTVNKFHVTDGMIIPSLIESQKLDNAASRLSTYNRYNMYGCIVSHYGGQVDRTFTSIIQDRITSITKRVDKYGKILANVKLSKYILDSEFNWSEIYTGNLSKGKLVCIDPSDKHTVLYSRFADNKSHNPVPSTLQCTCCGKLIQVPTHGIVTCDDPTCSSLQYQRVVNYLTSLHLPVVNSDEFDKLIKSNKHITILDVLNSKMYKDGIIRSTLGQQLNAFIPRDILPRKQDAYLLADKCNNSIEALLYYLDRPEKAYLDLDLNSHVFRRLFSWIQCDNNLSDLTELLNCGKIELVDDLCIVPNTPIFRDKSIYITGTFKHGSYSRIANILEGYAANVLYEYSDDCDCVLIGDIPENLNGRAMNKALKSKIPVIHESVFFDKYDIDSDINSLEAQHL